MQNDRRILHARSRGCKSLWTRSWIKLVSECNSLKLPRSSLSCPAFSLLLTAAHFLITLWHALVKSIAWKFYGINENSTANISMANGYFAELNM